MRLAIGALSGAIVVASFAASAAAQNQTAYVITGSGEALVHAPVDGYLPPAGQVWFDVVPDLTGVEMSRPDYRPDHRLDGFESTRVERKLPYQAQLLLANGTQMYVPLYHDYRSQARPWDGGIDEDHSIVRAERLMIGMTTGTRASVVRNPLLGGDEAMSTDYIQPSAVIHIPAPNRLRKKPKAPEADPQKVVLAD